MRTICRLGVVVALLLAGASAAAQSGARDYEPVTEEMLVSPPPGDWLMWRRTYGHWGHSPLDQINAANVGSLRLAWGLDHGARPSGNDAARPRRNDVPGAGLRFH